MSYIGYWPVDKYKADFPLDFGHGIRGDWLEIHQEKVGVIIVHRKDEMDVCALTAYWTYGANKVTLLEAEPLTIAPAITCSCGMHGFIKDGKWLNLQ